MALFGKKKNDDGEAQAPGAGEGAGGSSGAGANGKGKAKGGFEPEPGKAQKFFQHARAMHDSANYEYSMTLWLQGIRKDPTGMESLEKFFDTSANFLAKNPKAKGPTKDQQKQFGGRGSLEKYLSNLLNWGTKPQDWSSGFKAMECAADLGLDEQAYWIGERVMGIARNDKKAKKDAFVGLMDVFEKIGGWDKALMAGEVGLQIDPRDTKLEQRVRNMSATATMSRGGYETSGQEGGFRRNIKDLAGQRSKEEEERLVKSEETLDQVILRAADDYKSRPNDEAAALKLGKFLLERGKPEDEQTAYKLYMKMFKDTQSYRFKQLAGDIRMRVARRKVRVLHAKAEKEPGNAELRQLVVDAQRELLEFEMKEYEERVVNYPTDLHLKYELGVRHYRAGDYEKAIKQFQGAQGAPGLTSRVQNYLGQAFAKMEWLDEAESSFRAAIDGHASETDELAMEFRYGLMDALERKAESHRDVEAAEEAFKLASAIAVKQIGYRDIRARRAKIQALAKELKAGA